MAEIIESTFKPGQLMNLMFSRKAVDEIILMLINTCDQIVGDPDIQSAISGTGQDINASHEIETLE